MCQLFLREMLERALVKRLRDSDSDSDKEEEGESLQSNKSSTDKPTDILTIDKPAQAPVRMTTHIQQSVCLIQWLAIYVFEWHVQVFCHFLQSIARFNFSPVTCFLTVPTICCQMPEKARLVLYRDSYLICLLSVLYVMAFIYYLFSDCWRENI